MDKLEEQAREDLRIMGFDYVDGGNSAKYIAEQLINLGKEISNLRAVATLWMDEYQELKDKYEPEILVNSMEGSD